MKRIVSFISCFIVCVCVLLGCGKDMSGSKYVGMWKATKGEYSGVELSMEDLNSEFTVELKDNGKAVVTFNGENGNGNWDETDNGVEVSDSQDTFAFKADGDNLVVEQDGVTFTFEKTK
ncbi:MAG: hypothetical protein J6D36_03845 [Erysipelotrichaceae bacterium]|nr:hypothetical protein [Erysipelotrichaceae bacterium]